MFELVIILTLGSAAGDVSLYDDVPLLPVAAVFATLLALYRLTVFLMSRSPRFGVWLEGKPVTIIRDGIYELRSLDSMNISADEFFMELRTAGRGASRPGQTRHTENDGNVSLFFHEPEAVRPGSGFTARVPAGLPADPGIGHVCLQPLRLSAGAGKPASAAMPAVLQSDLVEGAFHPPLALMHGTNRQCFQPVS